MDLNETHYRHCMLYEFRRGSNATEAVKNICSVYGDVISVRKCQEWFTKFRSDNFDLKDIPRSGRPSELDNDALTSVVESDPRLTSRELAEKFKCDQSTIIRHLHQIGKSNKAGIWVPHQLSHENLLQRISICTSLLAREKSNSFLNRIVTGDEKCVLYVNAERKNQWLSPGQKPIPTPKAGLHPKKVMLSVWWDMEGVVYFELLDMNQGITADIYCEQLDRLKSALTTKRPALINRKGVILQQDNARPHTAKVTRQKVMEFGWEILPHPPYSPDIAPSDYYLFKSLEHFLRGKEFKDKNEIQTSLSDFFLSKPKQLYQNGIESLVKRWHEVIENDGNYVLT